MAVLRRIVARLELLLRPRLAVADGDARPRDALGAAQAEALHSLGAAPPDTGRAKQRAAYLAGFSLHAAVHLHANDRDSRTAAATAPALRFRRSSSPNCPTAVSPTGSSAPSARAARWCCCSGVPRQRRPAPPLRRPRILLQPRLGLRPVKPPQRCGALRTHPHPLGRTADARLPRGRARLPLRRPPRRPRLPDPARAGEDHPRPSRAAVHRATSRARPPHRWPGRGDLAGRRARAAAVAALRADTGPLSFPTP